MAPIKLQMSRAARQMAGETAIVEGVKFIGGLAGIGTAAFTVWDRLLRDRPLVTFAARADAQDDPEPRMTLRVKNAARAEIIVGRVVVTPGRLRFHPASLSAIFDAVHGEETPMTIAPGEVLDLVCTTVPARAALQVEEALTVDVHWQRLDNPRLPTWRVRRTLSPDLQRRLLQAARNEAAVRDKPLGL